MKTMERHLLGNRIRRAMRTPIRHWTREAEVRVRRGLFWERWMRGRALAPYSVGLWITEDCDLRCPMCWVHPNDSGEGGNHSLNREEWFQLIDELSVWKPRLTITGGEPLLVPYVIDLVRYAVDKGFRVNLGTNGTHLGELAEDLVLSGLQDVSVSVDGPADVHDRIRGKVGVFDAVRDGVKKVLDIRKATGRMVPYVRLNCTLTKINQGVLADVVDLAEDWEVDSLSFQHLWFISPEVLRRHNKLFLKEYHQESPYLSGFMVNGMVPDPVQLTEELTRLKDIIDNHLPVYVYPRLDGDEIRIFYEEPGISLRNRCRSRWFRTDVRPNGDVSPCLSYVAGSIRQSSFVDIWNNDRYRRFRRSLLRGLFPGCNQCCGLFSD